MQVGFDFSFPRTNVVVVRIFDVLLINMLARFASWVRYLFVLHDHLCCLCIIKSNSVLSFTFALFVGWQYFPLKTNQLWFHIFCLRYIVWPKQGVCFFRTKGLVCYSVQKDNVGIKKLRSFLSAFYIFFIHFGKYTISSKFC